MTPKEVQDYIASRAKSKVSADTRSVIEAERSAIETMLGANIPASDIAKLMSARYGGDPSVGAFQVAMSRLGLKRANKSPSADRATAVPSVPTQISAVSPRDAADPGSSTESGIVPPKRNRNTFD